MGFWSRRNGSPEQPVWVLGVDSVAWIDDREEVIDGVLVKFTKPGWSWTVLREDLDWGKGRLVAAGPAETREEALEIGMGKLREYKALA